MNKLVFGRISVLVLLVLSFFSNSVLAKPMPSASIEEGARMSEVYLCSFIDRKRGAKASYFEGTVCRYKILKAVNGKNQKIPAGKIINVRYDFDDGSACIAPKDWQFDPARLPARGTKWFMFLRMNAENGVYSTYRGSYGRKPFSKALEEKIAKLYQ